MSNSKKSCYRTVTNYNEVLSIKKNQPPHPSPPL